MCRAVRLGLVAGSAFAAVFVAPLAVALAALFLILQPLILPLLLVVLLQLLPLLLMQPWLLLQLDLQRTWMLRLLLQRPILIYAQSQGLFFPLMIEPILPQILTFFAGTAGGGDLGAS